MNSEMMSTVFMLVLMFAMLYFFMIRPENKRKKEAQNMRDSLAVGDEITTIGGITGTICAVKENTIVIETGADRVRIEFTKWAVSSNNTAEKAASKAKEAAVAALQNAISTIDKAATKGVYHKNTASRKISRLTKAVNNVQ